MIVQRRMHPAAPRSERRVDPIRLNTRSEKREQRDLDQDAERPKDADQPSGIAERDPVRRPKV